MPFREQLRSFTRPFWAANVMEVFERLPYYGARVVVPVYIASSQDPNGLHFDNRAKGIILTCWTLIQSLLPMFVGGFADKYGRRTTMGASVGLKVAGYLLMATQRSFWGFFLGCQLLAVASAFFKPGQQATLARALDERNSALGWGIVYQVVGLAGWLGPPVAGFLRRLSWSWVFLACAAIVGLNGLVLLNYREPPPSAEETMHTRSTWGVVVHAVRTMVRPRLLAFLVAMSGFFGLYFQLFDSMPNYIEEWIDSRDVIALFGLREGWLAVSTPRGLQVPPELLINIEGTAVVLLMLPITALTAKLARLPALAVGGSILSVGFLLAGITPMGLCALFGIFVCALGEMMGGPKFWAYLASIAPRGEEALYMGFTGVPAAIGVTGATYAGSFLYDRVADKANLALRYLGEHRLVPPETLASLTRPQAMAELQRVTQLDATRATRLLWDTYHPYTFWFVFVGLGLASSMAFVLYARAAQRWEQGKS
ncbi:MFS transporter [Pendulispora rubella]|uniref:MFS transporter n=1 Tax=Pendulispora rubella TaxID=2741070 RepID=A0ABZ2L2K8_9BACT